MNGYLEVKAGILRKAYANYCGVRDLGKVRLDRWIEAYKKQFGKEPLTEDEKGKDGYALFRELMKCKENINEERGERTCTMLDNGISYFFDPDDYLKGQRREVRLLLSAVTSDDDRLLLDNDLCNFLVRWKDGGAFLLKENKIS